MSYEAIYKGQPLLGGAAGGSPGGGVPSGCILIWSGSADSVPQGWALCDGQNGRPDLRDRFVLGAGSSHKVGDSGGSEEVTLTVEQMPKHIHWVSAISSINSKGTSSGAESAVSSISYGKVPTDYAGDSEPHNNMPPYYALCYIIKL